MATTKTKTTKPKTKRLTVKQTKLVQGIAQGKTVKVAGQEAGYGTTPESSRVIAHEVLRNPTVQEALQVALEKNGITLDRAIAPIGKALVATKVLITGKDEDAFAEVVDDIDVQLKGSDRALKLMGISQGDTNNQTVNINFNQVAEDVRKSIGI